ncbi:FadR/GntR family transcriptional regulator [Oceanibacterium hippocampi]|uniref:HTH-type transcriptional regulator LutR n=1 Tax=Oceanibacterium hippocampi TaxID=745714 RepID=A0A1Y5TSX1_9PROT|nr:FCD domain-containing protein [Oceanibacterium hippocampi]SLN70664.1 HTH-type transcriptional regulator LutR [Oceanibacterium hippocampi]
MTDAQFSVIERMPTYRLVFNAVQNEILSGRLGIGERLPSETALADQFGVNRSTVREGIRLLEESGLVTRKGGGRPRVALPHYLDLASRASRALILHSVTFRELWEAAVIIEQATAEYAASRITPEHLERLQENIDRMAAMVARVEADEPINVDDFVAIDAEFHDIISEGANNRVLALAREPVSRLFIPAGRIILPRLRTHRRVLDAHMLIRDALAAGDATRVRDWMRRHMEDFKRGYDRTGLAIDMPLDAVALGHATD